MSETVCFLKTKLLLLESTIIFPYPSLPIRTLMTFMGPCLLRGFIPKWRRCSSRYYTAQHPEPLWRTSAVHQWIRGIRWILRCFMLFLYLIIQCHLYTVKWTVVWKEHEIQNLHRWSFFPHSISKKSFVGVGVHSTETLGWKHKLPQKLKPHHYCWWFKLRPTTHILKACKWLGFPIPTWTGSLPDFNSIKKEKNDLKIVVQEL